MPKDSQQVTRDEHATISNVDGKRVFVIDDSANQITDFVNPTANITVHQASSPTIIAYAHFGSNATQVAELRMDASTHTIQTIDYVHHEIHSGDHYFLDGYVTLGDGGEMWVNLVTPNSTKQGHLTWSIGSSGICTTELYEGTSGASGGVTITPVNSNRNSANTSDMIVKSNVSATQADGTLLSQARWGATGFKTTVGGSTARENEIILKQNESYLRKFISGAADNIVSFRADWYEHTDKS